MNEKLRIAPLGGLGEIGINMMAYEFGEDIIVVDMGVGFPGAVLSGVQYIIPNYAWLEARKARIRGVVITHGHMDHIGAIPFILPRLGFPPIYSLALTVGLIKRRLEEFTLMEQPRFHVVDPDDVIQLGNFQVRFFRVNHSIPDSMGLSIMTPVGQIIHTGDWKLDFTSGDKHPMELNKLMRFGSEGVLALLSDSTNARVPGHSISEKTLAGTIDDIFKDTPGRMVFTCNALILTRIQQVLNAAMKHGRKVAIVGRSMQNNIDVAISLGYITVGKSLFIKPEHIKKYPDRQIAVLTTGGQGEESAGLPRMARGDHKQFRLRPGDTAVISANPIPGNERTTQLMINNLGGLGVRVIYNKLLDIHASGHARQDELKMMLGMVRPRYFIPIHGEHHMLVAHGKLAESIGMPPEHIFVMDNGQIIEMDRDHAQVTDDAVPAHYLFVDESGAGEVDIETRDAQEQMKTEGVVTIITPYSRHDKKIQTPLQILSRGFVFVKNNDALFRELTYEIQKTLGGEIIELDDCVPLEDLIRSCARKFLFERTGRRPFVVPVVVQV